MLYLFRTDYIFALPYRQSIVHIVQYAMAGIGPALEPDSGTSGVVSSAVQRCFPTFSYVSFADARGFHLRSALASLQPFT
jgi:hypothetical protein